MPPLSSIPTSQVIGRAESSHNRESLLGKHPAESSLLVEREPNVESEVAVPPKAPQSSRPSLSDTTAELHSSLRSLGSNILHLARSQVETQRTTAPQTPHHHRTLQHSIGHHCMLCRTPRSTPPPRRTAPHHILPCVPFRMRCTRGPDPRRATPSLPTPIRSASPCPTLLRPAYGEVWRVYRIISHRTSPCRAASHAPLLSSGQGPRLLRRRPPQAPLSHPFSGAPPRRARLALPAARHYGQRSQ